MLDTLDLLSCPWSLAALATMMPSHLSCLALVLSISDFYILKLISALCSISSPYEVCMAITLRFSSLAPFIPSFLLILVVVIAYPTHLFLKKMHATHVQIPLPPQYGRDGLLPSLPQHIWSLWSLKSFLWYFRFSVLTCWCLYAFIHFHHAHPKCLIKLQSPWG